MNPKYDFLHGVSRDSVGLPRDAYPDLGAPDMQTQLEDLWFSVWQGEKDWRLCDRIDLAMKLRRNA